MKSKTKLCKILKGTELEQKAKLLATKKAREKEVQSSKANNINKLEKRQRGRLLLQLTKPRETTKRLHAEGKEQRD